MVFFFFSVRAIFDFFSVKPGICYSSHNSKWNSFVGRSEENINVIAKIVVCVLKKRNIKEIKYCSDRKEEKDHGADKGALLGYKIKDGDKVVIIEDVTTSGKSIDETYPKIKAQESVPGGIKIVGEIVSLNRMEKAADSAKSALETITEKYGFPAKAIVTMADVVDTLYTNGDKKIITPEIKNAIDEYYSQYGAAGMII